VVDDAIRQVIDGTRAAWCACAKKPVAAVRIGIFRWLCARMMSIRMPSSKRSLFAMNKSVWSDVSS
jgi:hypothetical protein